LPPNVTVVENISSPCALTILSPSDPTTFCGSTKYNDLSAILTTSSPTISLAENKDAVNHINKISINPNPAKNNAILSFKLVRPSSLKIVVYNSSGTRVLNVENRNSYSAGNYNIKLNTETLPTGLYVVKIESDEFSVAKKLLVTK
jgi:Secretion system C-terminal sorting domain